MTVLGLVPLLFAWQLSLPEAVEEWRREIEGSLGGAVRILVLPAEEVSEEDRAVLEAYWANPGFQQAFRRAQALTLSVRLGGQLRPYVLLNRARLEESRQEVGILVAHELGHVWLQTQGMLPPKFGGGCVEIHSGDIVQHEWIRAEMDRRGLDWRSSYRRDYEWALERSRKGGGVAGDLCLRAQRVSLMVDLRRGFAADGNEWRNEYLAILGRQDPEGEALAIEMAEWLEAENYAAALDRVQSVMLGWLAQTGLR
jgi:hypothetical protein